MQHIYFRMTYSTISQLGRGRQIGCPPFSRVMQSQVQWAHTHTLFQWVFWRLFMSVKFINLLTLCFYCKWPTLSRTHISKLLTSRLTGIPALQHEFISASYFKNIAPISHLHLSGCTKAKCCLNSTAITAKTCILSADKNPSPPPCQRHNNTNFKPKVNKQHPEMNQLYCEPACMRAF